MSPVVLLYLYYFVRSAAYYPAQLFQSDHRDILILFQRVQRFGIYAAFEQLILRNALLLHSVPQRIIREYCDHPHNSFHANYIMACRK